MEIANRPGPVEASSLQGPPGTHAGTAARVTFDQER